MNIKRRLDYLFDFEKMHLCSADGESGDPPPAPDENNPPAPDENNPPAPDENNPPSRKNIMDSGDDTNKRKGESGWGDDWRTRMLDPLGLDDSTREKVAKQLERASDPSAVLKRWMDADKRVKELGNGAPALPENPTDEQLSEYRRTWPSKLFRGGAVFKTRWKTPRLKPTVS